MSDPEPAEADAPLDAVTQRRVVRERYARIATDASTEGGCCSSDEGCSDAAPGSPGMAEQLGYSKADVESAGDADLGLGCGNPRAIASITEGETVLDLGSGAGFDCFLAAREVGETGRVIGVDMTPEMVERARANAADDGTDRVEFRLGEIEHLPVADGSVDVVISNCVVNLSPNKSQVFREAYRVLGPGGRLAISDVVMTAEPPRELPADPDSVASCVAGASTIDRLRELLVDAGFERIDVSPKADSDRFIREWDDDHDVSKFLVSASITARKPEDDE